jgi:hypothetical protein
MCQLRLCEYHTVLRLYNIRINTLQYQRRPQMLQLLPLLPLQLLLLLLMLMLLILPLLILILLSMLRQCICILRPLIRCRCSVALL